MRYRKFIVIIGSLIVMLVFFVQCVERGAGHKDPRGNEYAGSGSCAPCHQEIVTSYLHDNHSKTSAVANLDSLTRFIDGSEGRFYYGDSSFVQTTNTSGSFIQSHIVDGKPVQSVSLDIAIGSGEKAQSYGYWKNEQLFQLPLTYFSSLHRWTNSPGFPTAQPYFNRVILSRCFECHASYVEKTDIRTGALQVSEKLIPASFVYGIDCERCHGPAAEHVSFHEDHPGLKEAKHIASIQSLPRERKLDLCGSCHSGNDLDVQRTLFAFKPGDTLANFYFPHFGRGKDPDVHGKQLQLLQASQCYIQSDMTCGTCHTMHIKKDKGLKVYDASCMNCHQQGDHVLQMKAESRNCVSCHMPQQDSKKLNFDNSSGGSRIPYYLRNHRIAVYKDEPRNDARR